MRTFLHKRESPPGGCRQFQRKSNRVKKCRGRRILTTLVSTSMLQERCVAEDGLRDNGSDPGEDQYSSGCGGVHQ
jgi:hypothetical protein